jgi:tRNA threonylcarbamoyladenosine biosynthesis protein TsaE
VVALIGPLGAGKTVFVKGLAEGLGIDSAQVVSPTFVIAAQHEGQPGGATARRLVHVDLYRVGSAAELDDAGWLDWLQPGALVAVEWGGRFPEALPDDHLEVSIEGRTDARTIALAATGPRARVALTRLRERATQEGDSWA